MLKAKHLNSRPSGNRCRLDSCRYSSDGFRRSERLKKFATQEKFREVFRANGLDVTRSGISMWELGLGMPGADVLYVIAETIGVTVARLLPPDPPLTKSRALRNPI